MMGPECSTIVHQCAHCGERTAGFDGPRREVCCLECRNELFFGWLPSLTRRLPAERRGGVHNLDSASGENAVRHLEDCHD